MATGWRLSLTGNSVAHSFSSSNARAPGHALPPSAYVSCKGSFPYFGWLQLPGYEHVAAVSAYCPRILFSSSPCGIS